MRRHICWSILQSSGSQLLRSPRTGGGACGRRLNSSGKCRKNAVKWRFSLTNDIAGYINSICVLKKHIYRKQSNELYRRIYNEQD